jgi:hypothetical protein
MAAVARNVPNAAAQRERRQRIILIALLVVLAAVLAFELPKLLKGSSSPSASSSTSVTTTTATGVVATATATVTGGTYNPYSASVIRRERAIKRLPSRDPFVPLAGAVSATPEVTPNPTVLPNPDVTTTPATLKPVTKPATVTKKPTATVKTVTVSPKLVPTAAVIWTNGQRQVIGADQLFKVGDTTFKLVTIGPKSATVTVPVGGIQGGKKQVVLPRDKSVTLQNTVTGVQYVLRFTLPMSVVPASTGK